jgi:hypothetical protein
MEESESPTSRYVVVGAWDTAKRLRVYQVARESAWGYEVTPRIRSTGKLRSFPQGKCCAVTTSKEAAREIVGLHQEMHRAIRVLLDGYRGQMAQLLEEASSRDEFSN